MANILRKTKQANGNEIFKRMTRDHTDMTFISWPDVMSQRKVQVYTEERKQRKIKSNPHVMQRTKYRHLMTSDCPESLPFADPEQEAD